MKTSLSTLLSFGMALTSLGLATAAVSAGTLTETKLVDSDGQFLDRFGWSVAAEGNLVVVGAKSDDVGSQVDQGSAIVYRRTPQGWVEEQKLFAVAGQPNALFGTSVSISGEVIVAGMPHAQVAGGLQQGLAVVFRWIGTGWVETQSLALGDRSASGLFGSSVAVGGDVIVVGAPRYDLAGQPEVGSALVYRWQGAGWVEEQQLWAQGPGPFEHFGSSVAVSEDGEVIVVGVPDETIGGHPRQGSATVFGWNGSSWVEEQRLWRVDGGSTDGFGQAVSVDGQVIVVGVPFAEGGVAADEGAAVVFRQTGQGWVEEQQLMASSGAVGANYGTTVSVDGPLIALGAPFADSGGVVAAGSAAVFQWDGSQWTEQVLLNPSDGVAGGQYGRGLAVFGSSVVVGSPYADAGSSPHVGEVYVHDSLLNAFSDQGNALAGVFGDPLLVGSGSLVVGSNNTIDLSNSAPTAITALFVAGSSNPAPFFGGTLMPFPHLGAPIMGNTDISGTIGTSFIMPGDVLPGSQLWLQFAIVDPVAVQGVALSNAILGVSP